MVFHAKIDKYFSVIVCFYILIIGVVTLPLAFLVNEGIPIIALLLICIFIIPTCFLLWILLSNTYIFHENYLLIKSGPFRTRIPYKEITRVAPERSLSIKFEITSSRDTLQLFNTISAFKHARISPINKQEFIRELKNRNPHIQIDE